MRLASFTTSDGITEIAVNPDHVISVESDYQNNNVLVHLSGTTHGISVKGTLADVIRTLERSA